MRVSRSPLAPASPAGLPRFAPSSALRGKEGLTPITVFEGLEAILVDYQDYH